MSALKTCKYCGKLFTGKQSVKCLSCLLVQTNANIDRLSQRIVVEDLTGKLVMAHSEPFKVVRKADAPSASNKVSNQTVKKGSTKAHVADAQILRRLSNPQNIFTPSNSPSTKTYIFCPICEMQMEPILVTDHNREIHGISPQQFKKSRHWTVSKKTAWVSVISGGLPSLGKRSR